MMGSLRSFIACKLTGSKAMTNEDRPRTESGGVDWQSFDQMREEYPICIDHEADMISFKLMTKPVSEGGTGAQLTDFIEVATHILEYLNGKFPCRENRNSLLALKEALDWQRIRTNERKSRGVEGSNRS